MNKTPEQLALDIVKRSVNRFGKVFVASGLAAIVTIQPPLHNTNADLLMWGHALLIAFVAGGILGLEKLISQVYVSQTPPQAQVTPQAVAQALPPVQAQVPDQNPPVVPNP